MQRVLATRNPALDLFGDGKHGFKAGNPATGEPATTPGFEMFNALQEEICGVIEAAGHPLDPDKRDQLLTAIRSMVNGSVKHVEAVTNVDVTALPDGIPLFAKGRDVAGDGGGGWLRYVADSAATVDGVFVYAPASGAGRLVRDFTGSIHPKWAGVKADGAADDAAAWALFWAAYSAKSTVITVPAGGTPTWTAPSIEPINGKTLLSTPMQTPSYIKADFSSLQIGRHPSWAQPAGTYLVTSAVLYQADFGGLRAREEDYFLEIKNPNPDQGYIEVSGIQMRKCDHAIRVEAQSTAVFINRFKSDSCKTLLTVDKCDRLVLDKGWISQGALDVNQSATIVVNAGTLIIGDVLGVPTAHTGSEVAWINVFGASSVDVKRMRFGGENGSCTMVNYFGTADVTYPRIPTRVEVCGSETYTVATTGGFVSCAIRLFKLPNVLRFDGNQGLIDTQQWIAWGSTANQAAELAAIAAIRHELVYSCRYNYPRQGVKNIPDNLRNLFTSTENTVTLIPVTGAAGESVCDTVLVPDKAASYELRVSANPTANGSVNYRSVVSGNIDVGVVLVAGVYQKQIKFTKLSGFDGGSSPTALIITPVYWNGSSERSFVPYNDTTATIRIKVSGFPAGYEGAGFSGVLKAVL